jgi:hypothetical protein
LIKVKIVDHFLTHGEFPILASHLHGKLNGEVASQ